MRILLLLLLVFFNFASYGQVIPSTLIKYQNNNLIIYGSIENRDNLFLFGTVGNENLGDSPCLTKMDSNGDILWTKTYSGTGNILIRSGCLNEANGVTLIGNSIDSQNSENNDIIILKVSDEGDIEWSKKYGGNEQERSFKIIQLDDDSYIVCGSTRSIGSGEEDAFVMRIDAFGNIIWDRIFGGGYRDNAFDIIHSNDNTLVFTGAQSSFGSGEYDFGLTKLDLDGNLVFFKTIGTYMQDHSRVVHQVNDGGYVILGHTDNYSGVQGLWDILLIKTDISGKVEWSKRYHTNEENYTGDFIELSDGFMITGSTLHTGERNLFALKTNFNGDIQWGTLFDIPDFQEFPFGAKSTCISAGSDQYRAVGRTLTNGKSTGLLLSFSSEQNELCHEIDYNPYTENLTLVSYDNSGMIGITQGFGSNNISLNQSSISIEMEDLCSLKPIAKFKSDKQKICKEECISFTDLSTNIPETYKWTFESGIPSASTEKNPIVCYPVPGKFSVSLKVESAEGSDELIINDYITVAPTPNFSLGDDVTICDSDSIVLKVEGYDLVIWQDGSISSQFLANDQGTYQATVYNSDGCSSTDAIFITVAPNPEFSLGKDSTLCDSESILLTAEGYDAVIWKDGSTENYLIADAPGFYYATVYNSDGCLTSDTIFISACCDYSLYIPNAFTPNDDGYNDVFKPIIHNVLNYSMTIANRWGAEIFFTNDQDEAWDGKYKGKSCSQGVYLVIINFSTCDEYGNLEKRTGYGSVTLLR